MRHLEMGFGICFIIQKSGLEGKPVEPQVFVKKGDI